MSDDQMRGLKDLLRSESGGAAPDEPGVLRLGESLTEAVEMLSRSLPG